MRGAEFTRTDASIEQEVKLLIRSISRLWQPEICPRGCEHRCAKPEETSTALPIPRSRVQPVHALVQAYATGSLPNQLTCTDLGFLQ